MQDNFSLENLKNNIILNAKDGKTRFETANDVDNLVSLLDSFASSDVGRLKLKVSESTPSGSISKQYHHGRCDIGSPWEKGKSFDVLE